MNKQEKTGDYLWFGLFLILVAVSSVIWFEYCGRVSIKSDGSLYYEYFTRLFITCNLSESGLIKYPVGTTLLQLPFLIVAYAISSAFGIDLKGGTNALFQYAVFAAALFWCLFAFILIYRFLRKKYLTSASILCCFCLFYGTMLPVYITEKASFSHAYGFFTCTAFWVYLSYYEENRKKKSILSALVLDLLLGALLGFCAIIRNTNVIIGAAYVFYCVDSFQALRKRIKTLVSTCLILQVIGFLVIYGIQMIFWKKMTNSWILYSYVGEAFSNLTKPKILSVLFSDSKGLFIFCPILMIAVISMICFREENKEYRVAQWIIFFGVTYIISAWWCWWLGTAYGERVFCDVLCIFALPLAAFYEKLHEWRKELSDENTTKMDIKPIFCYVISIAFVMLNMSLIYATSIGAVSDNLATWYELRSFLTSIGR